MDFKRRWEKSILKRIKNHGRRAVVLIGDDLFSNAVYENLLLLNIIVIHKISDTNFINSDIGKYEDVFFLMAQYRGHKEVYECLVKAGFVYQEDFALMGIGGYIESVDCVDPLLTFNRSEEKYPGIKVYGNTDSANVVIATLGNSTSDPYTGGDLSWSEILYQKLNAKYTDVSLLNCAMTGYNSTQEYLKFNRDILELNPDILIMVSGYNDIEGNSNIDNLPYTHKYQKRFYDFLSRNEILAPDSMDMRDLHKISYGVSTKVKGYNTWLNNVRKISALCNEFNIKFYPYLQPMVEYGEYIIEDDLVEIFNEYFGVERYKEMQLKTRHFCEQVLESKKMYKMDYLGDLTTIFKNEKGIYYDTCHCNYRGNEIIAKLIYNDIIREMENQYEEN